MATSKAFVLHSGGIDSSTCLYLAKREYTEVVGVSILYGQRHSKETDQAGRICELAKCEHRVIRMTEPPKTMLTDGSESIPDVGYEDLPKGISPTYVPFRNGQMLSLLAGIAQAKEGSAIYFGAHAEDAQNWAYPDCTPEFIGAMANAIYVGTYHKVRLVTPLQWMKKDEIIKIGYWLGVPWEHTWSCYKGEEIHCGTCPTCRSRRDGFRKSSVTDPTIYKSSTTPFMPAQPTDSVAINTLEEALPVRYSLAVPDSDGDFAIIAGSFPTIDDCKQQVSVAEGMMIIEHYNGVDHVIRLYTRQQWHSYDIDSPAPYETGRGDV